MLITSLRRHIRLLTVSALAVLVGIGAVQAKQAGHMASSPQPRMSTDPQASTGDLVVDIEGAVAVPGARHIAKGSLVDDALNQAGGLTEQADLAKVAQTINRADQLKDHQKPYVPLTGDTATSGDSQAVSGMVNINEATSAELDTLPGVGPGTAKKIIDYRAQNGPFATPEDLQNIPGITAKKFDQLKDKITV